MDSPVLFVRSSQDETKNARKRGIPVEYVRAVVEVKSTFNKAMAEKAVSKLLRLQAFRQDDALPGPLIPDLPAGFAAAAIFFETKVKSATEFRDALGEFAKFWQVEPALPFAGGLIIRGETHPAKSAVISQIFTGGLDVSDILRPGCELSNQFVPASQGGSPPVGFILSGGFGENEFWQYMLNFVHTLNGRTYEMSEEESSLLNGYGTRFGIDCVTLFPSAESPPK